MSELGSTQGDHSHDLEEIALSGPLSAPPTLATFETNVPAPSPPMVAGSQLPLPRTLESELIVVRQKWTETFRRLFNHTTAEYDPSSLDPKVEGLLNKLDKLQHVYDDFLQDLDNLSRSYKAVQDAQSNFVSLLRSGDIIGAFSSQESCVYLAEAEVTILHARGTISQHIDYFAESTRTFLQKAVEDILMTTARLERSRLEYNAFRSHLRSLISKSAFDPKIPQYEAEVERLRKVYFQLTADVGAKLTLMEEKRIVDLELFLARNREDLEEFFGSSSRALTDLGRFPRLSSHSLRSESPHDAVSAVSSSVSSGTSHDR